MGERNERGEMLLNFSEKIEYQNQEYNFLKAKWPKMDLKKFKWVNKKWNCLYNCW